MPASIHFCLSSFVAFAVSAIIGVGSILFSFSMFVQQRLNPSVQDETQKIIIAWMPWIFLFVFSGFASGLVVYWIWNNTLSIIQQAIITRKINEDAKE